MKLQQFHKVIRPEDVIKEVRIMQGSERPLGSLPPDQRVAFDCVDDLHHRARPYCPLALSPAVPTEENQRRLLGEMNHGITFMQWCLDPAGYIQPGSNDHLEDFDLRQIFKLFIDCWHMLELAGVGHWQNRGGSRCVVPGSLHGV